MPRFSKAELEAARDIFEGRDKDHAPCQDCGGLHTRACPRIASEHIILHPERSGPNGEAVVVDRHVTYWPNGQWEENVIFPDMAYEDDDSDGSQPDPGSVPDGQGAGH